jgi:hypothetical protein
LLQTENLLAAALVGLVACLLAGRLATRIVFLVLWVGLTFYLVFNQVYYKIFFDHFRPSSVEGMGPASTALLFDSLVHELDLAFVLNSVLVVVATAFLTWQSVLRPAAAAALAARWGRDGWLLAAGAVLLLIAGTAMVLSPAYRNVQHHPLLILAHDALRRNLIDDLRPGGAAAEEDEATAPLEIGPPEQDRRLAALVQACRDGARPPSVLLIVLESVGSRQLLGSNGLPSPPVAPRLAQLARGGWCSIRSTASSPVRSAPTWRSRQEAGSSRGGASTSC